MKNVIIVLLTILIASCFLFAQGPAGSNPGGPIANSPFIVPYDATRPPPLGLTGAYAMSLSFVGTATNRFYCVSATCLEKTKSGLPGWKFTFCNTNQQHVVVNVPFVADFDKGVSSDQEDVLRGK